MDLNKVQRYSLLLFLSKELGIALSRYDFYEFEKFCDGGIREWRIIAKYGMAGKIWNNNDRIYISGHSRTEIGHEAFIDQRVEIEDLNEKLDALMTDHSNFTGC
jgi:hypothetical protein